MLPNRDNFLLQNIEGLAVCGLYCSHDNVHVGIYWNSEGEQKIVHFNGANNIKIEEAADISFQNYLFNPIANFPKSLIPSITAIAQKVVNNTINGLDFKRVGIYYDGGKFEFQQGSFTGKISPEKFINCAVFVIALLNSANNFSLIDWSSWPNASIQNRNFLDRWLDYWNIAIPNRDVFYNLTKEVRGKHVLMSPSAADQPANYNEVQPLADALIKYFNP